MGRYSKLWGLVFGTVAGAIVGGASTFGFDLDAETVLPSVVAVFQAIGVYTAPANTP